MSKISDVKESDVKLYLKVVNTPFGARSVLVDDKGLVIPNQIKVQTSNAVDENLTANVEFFVEWWEGE